MILDTNAFSALVDGEQTLLPIMEAASDVAIPVIVLGEYLFGIRGSRHRKEYEDWLEAHLSLFRHLRIDRSTASHYADVRRELAAVGRPIPMNDVWIAALAREHGLPVVSRDGHFANVRGIRQLRW